MLERRRYRKARQDDWVNDMQPEKSPQFVASVSKWKLLVSIHKSNGWLLEYGAIHIKRKTFMCIHYSMYLVNWFNILQNSNWKIKTILDTLGKKRKKGKMLLEYKTWYHMNAIMVELIDSWNQLRAKLPLNFYQKYVSLRT